MMIANSRTRFFAFLSGLVVCTSATAFSTGAMAACPEPHPAQEPPYVAANTVANVCTPADFALLQTEIAKDESTFDSVETALAAQNAACAACTFTSIEGAGWGPIVKIGEGAAFVNWGACFEKAEGGSQACGASIQKSELCIASRCAVGDGYCEDADAEDTCVDAVLSDEESCGKYDPVTDCDGNIASLFGECQSLVDIITVLCANESAPGSSSSSSSSSSSGSSGDDGSSSGGTSSSSSSSSGGSGTTNDAAPASTSDGCAQGGGSAGGSIASGLVVAFAAVAAVSRRRRKA